MIKKTFETKPEVDTYLAEQKIRMEKGYLTVSERTELKSLLEKPESLIVPKQKDIIEYKKIITNINALKVPCLEVRKDEDIKHIIKDLKDTLTNVGGLGLSANQIGYNRKISYIKIPKFTKDKKIEFNEYILINAKIIEKNRPIQVKNEECLSFPGIGVTTKRYIFITVEYLNEKMELQTGMFQDLESLATQHEIDHTNGITMFDRKWVT